MPFVPLMAGHTITQTDSVGLTDARLINRSLVRTDSVGLTDEAILPPPPAPNLIFLQPVQANQQFAYF